MNKRYSASETLRRAAETKGVAAAVEADRLDIAQHRIGAVHCTCGHRRAGHRSYYFETGSTACVENARCGCRQFVARAVLGETGEQ